MAKATPLTNKDIIKAFGVSEPTIYAWRHGTAKKEKLPHTRATTGRKEVQYKRSEVKAWAKKNGVPIKDASVFAAP